VKGRVGGQCVDFIKSKGEAGGRRMRHWQVTPRLAEAPSSEPAARQERQPNSTPPHPHHSNSID